MAAARFVSGLLLALVVIAGAVTFLAGTAQAQLCDTAAASPDTPVVCEGQPASGGGTPQAGGAGGAGGGGAAAASRIDAGAGGSAQAGPPWLAGAALMLAGAAVASVAVRRRLT